MPVDEQLALAFKNCRLAECNEVIARQYGYSTEAMIGKKISDLLIADDPDNSQFIRSFIGSGYNLSEAESHEKDDHGNDRYFLNNFVGFVIDGELKRVWGTQRDITASRQTKKTRRGLLRSSSPQTTRS